MPERDDARADAGSYADKRARMQAAGGFLIRGSHVTVRIWWARARGCRAVSAALSTRSEKFVMRHDSVKKIAACRMQRMPQAVVAVSRSKKERTPQPLRKPSPRLRSTSVIHPLGRATRTQRLGQRPATFFLPFGAPAAAFGAGHAAW